MFCFCFLNEFLLFCVNLCTASSQHISRVHVLKYERRNINNPVHTVHPSSVSRQRKVYQLVSPLEYFRISNFLFSYNHLCFAPRTWIKSKQGKAEGEKVQVMHSFRSHIQYLCSLGSSSPQSCCAVSIWIKLSCRRITSGTTTESHSLRGLRQEETEPTLLSR